MKRSYYWADKSRRHCCIYYW